MRKKEREREEISKDNYALFKTQILAKVNMYK